MTQESIEQKIHDLGRGVRDESVVIGSSAIKLALPGFRQPHDVDVAVSPEAFAHLRQQPGWEQTADGRLIGSGLDVGMGWSASTEFSDLQARSWQTETGVRVAGLPDVYAYKHRRANAQDVQDVEYIREYVQGVNAAPLAARQIPHEVAAARNCLPEELREDPKAQPAILLAANGLHAAYTIYGHPLIGQVGHIAGDLERPDFQVPATYHNGQGLIADAKALQRHLANVDAPAHDRFLALAADPFADSIYGNGRFSDNPEGYDELRSADLLHARALQLGFSDEDAERLHTVVLQTAFDEATGTQRGTHATDALARAIVAVDLQVLSEPNSVERVLDLAVEDGYSARYNKARTIGQVLNEHDERVCSTADALALIDRYADAKPRSAPDGPTAREAFARRLIGNATFQRNYQYPVDWTLGDRNLRYVHADKTEELGRQLLAQEITAVEAGRLAARHMVLHS